MVTLSHLFTPQKPIAGFDNTLRALDEGIDLAMERGECDKDVLHIMKELLGNLETPSMSDYVEEVNNG